MFSQQLSALMKSNREHSIQANVCTHRRYKIYFTVALFELLVKNTLKKSVLIFLFSVFTASFYGLSSSVQAIEEQTDNLELPITDTKQIPTLQKQPTTNDKIKCQLGSYHSLNIWQNNERHLARIQEENTLLDNLSALNSYSAGQTLSMLTAIIIKQFTDAYTLNQTLEPRYHQKMPEDLEPYYEYGQTFIRDLISPYTGSTFYYESKREQILPFSDCCQRLQVLLHFYSQKTNTAENKLVTALNDLKKIDNVSGVYLFNQALKLNSALSVSINVDETSFNQAMSARCWPLVTEVTRWLLDNAESTIATLLTQMDKKAANPQLGALFDYMRQQKQSLEKHQASETEAFTDEVLANPINKKLMSHVETVKSLYDYFVNKVTPVAVSPVAVDNEQQRPIQQSFSDRVRDAAKLVTNTLWGAADNNTPEHALSSWLRQIRNNGDTLSWQKKSGHKDALPDELVIEVLLDIAQEHRDLTLSLEDALTILVAQRYQSTKKKTAVALLLGRALPEDAMNKRYVPVAMDELLKHANHDENRRQTRSTTKRMADNLTAIYEYFYLSEKNKTLSHKKGSDKPQPYAANCVPKNNKGPAPTTKTKRPAEHSETCPTPAKRLAKDTTADLHCHDSDCPLQGFNRCHNQQQARCPHHPQGVYLLVPESEYLKEHPEAETYPKAEHTEAHNHWRVLMLVNNDKPTDLDTEETDEDQDECEADAVGKNDQPNSNSRPNRDASWNLNHLVCVGMVAVIGLGAAAALTEVGGQGAGAGDSDYPNLKCYNMSNKRTVCIADVPLDPRNRSLTRFGGTDSTYGRHVDKCPATTQRHFMYDVGKAICTNGTVYTCLRDDLNKGYTDGCFDYNYEKGGTFSVLRGGRDGVSCSKGTYQPSSVIYKTNASAHCTFKVNHCSEKGQSVKDEANKHMDNTCVCNFDNGFSFVNSNLKKVTGCKPLEQDCSCYHTQNITGNYHPEPGKNLTMTVVSLEKLVDDGVLNFNANREFLSALIGIGFAGFITCGCCVACGCTDTVDTKIFDYMSTRKAAKKKSSAQ